MHFCTYGKRALTCLCFPAPEQLQEGQRMHVVPLTVSVNAVLNYKLGRPLTALSINRLPSKHSDTFQRNKEQSLFWDSARKDADTAQTRLRFTSLASSLALPNNKSPTHTGVHLQNNSAHESSRTAFTLSAADIENRLQGWSL